MSLTYRKFYLYEVVAYNNYRFEGPTELNLLFLPALKF